MPDVLLIFGGPTDSVGMPVKMSPWGTEAPVQLRISGLNDNLILHEYNPVTSATFNVIEKFCPMFLLVYFGVMFISVGFAPLPCNTKGDVSKAEIMSIEIVEILQRLL
jgi:hypothetical protein